MFQNGIDPSRDEWKPKPKYWEGVKFCYTGAMEHIVDLAQVLGVQHAFDVWLLHTYNTSGYRGFHFFDGMPSDKYSELYDHYDVFIAPLADTKFNKHKSELKMIEAGFKHKPIIVSDVYKALENENNISSYHYLFF